MYIAVVELSNMKVFSLLDSDGNDDYICPSGCTAIWFDDTNVGQNWTFDGTKFIPPPELNFPEEPVPPQE